MRKIQRERKTNETEVLITLNLDGNGRSDIDTSVKFFDHMLELFTYYSGFDLTIKAKGDGVDNHHVIEDIGILFGQILYEALGNKEGINRYGLSFMPMDESLARVVVDLSGRSYLIYDIDFTREFLGDMETEMFEEFFVALANNAKMNLHIKSEYGQNNHHIIEGVFKGLGKALGQAVALTNSGETFSTKGVLE